MLRSTRAYLSIAIAAVSMLVWPIAAQAVVTITPGGFTPPPIKVAVVRSQTTLDWLNYRRTPSRYPHGSKEAALLYYLQGRGYDVTEIVGDRDLLNSDALKRFDVVVLPSMYALGRPASESLARYVAGGGGLVATMSSPRIDPAHAPRRGQKENMNEWWWRVMGSNYWEWGPLSAVYQAKFINDGAYTPAFTIRPNTASPIVSGVREILSARGFGDDLAGVVVYHPAANIEMSIPIPGGVDRQSAADFNLLTSSVKKRYPGTYTAVLGTRFGKGRSVKFYYGATDFLQNYNTALYSRPTPTGFPQGEVAEAYIESAIIWSATPDGTSVRSVDATTFANVSARGGRVAAKQYVTNSGNTLTKATVRFAIYNSSGRRLKSWSKKNVLFLPRQTRRFSYTYKRKPPSGPFRVVASVDYGYPSTSVRASSESTLTRGAKVRTH